MSTLALAELVEDIQSGDWGSTSQAGGLVQAVVLRATDFQKATIGDLSSAPRRYLRSSSVKARSLQANDFLIELSGGSADQPTGRLFGVPVLTSDLPVVFSNFVKRIRVRPGVEPAFFAFYWQWLYSQGVTRVYENRTTGIRNFKLDRFLASESLLLPALEEQRRVAAILSTIQHSRDVEASRVSALRAFRAASATSLLQGSEGRSQKHAFADLVTIVSGQVDPREHPYVDLPHIAPNNVETGTGRLLKTKSARQLALVSGKYAFESGDVIYSKIRPYLNKAVIAPFAGTCSADMYVLRADPSRLLQPYLHLLLLSDAFLTQAVSYQNRTGIPKINREELSGIVLNVPSLREQGRVCRAVGAAGAALVAAWQRSAALEGVMSCSMKALLGGVS
jgi:type I restriction enzyme S subunit